MLVCGEVACSVVQLPKHFVSPTQNLAERSIIPICHLIFL